METPLFSDEGLTPAGPAPSPRRSRWVFALAAAALLALGAGNAPAQTGPVCSNTPATGQWVNCEESAGSTEPIDIDIDNLTIEVPYTSTDDAVSGVHRGPGNVDIDVVDSTLTTAADSSGGVHAEIHGGNSYAEIVSGDIDTEFDIDIDVINTNITTMGRNAWGIFGWHKGVGDLDIGVTGGNVTTQGNRSHSIYGYHIGDGTIKIDLSDVTIETQSDEDTNSNGVAGWHYGTGAIDIDVSGGSIETSAENFMGILAERRNIADAAGVDYDIDVDVTEGTTITTTGALSRGIWGRLYSGLTGDLSINVRDAGITTNSYLSEGIYGVHEGTGDLLIDLQNSTVATNGTDLVNLQGLGPVTLSNAVYGFHGGGSDGDVRISVTGGSFTTRGLFSHGIVGNHIGNRGDVVIDVRDATVRTESTALHTSFMDTTSLGIYANHAATGNVDVSVTGGSVETLGVNSHGILAYHRSTTDPERSIDVTVEGASVTARGAGANAIQVGAARGGIAQRAAALGADGYRMQTVRVNGRVYGGSGQDTAGVYLGGGGKVYIGPRGSVGADSGIAILATGSAPKLYLDMDLDGRRLAQVIGDDWIINDGGRTTIVVNDVTLHDERGVTGLEAPNGAFDLTMRREGVRVTDRTTDPWSVSALATGTGRDRDFSAGDFIEPSPLLAHVELASQRGSGGEWSTGEQVEVRVRFSKRVRVEVPAGGRGPEFVLIFCHEEDDRGDCMGGETSPAFAAYTGGAGTDTLTFAYTVDSSQDGAKSVAVPHFGLVKRDARIVSAEDSAEDDEAVDHRFQHNAVFNLFLRADDNRDRRWTEGETIEVIVRFRREVVVSTSGGTPTIDLQIGNGRGFGRTKGAAYARVSNEDQSAGLYTDLVFEYPVSAADGEVRVVKVLANSLRRNGAAIRDRQGYEPSLGHEEKEWSTIPLTVRFDSQPERHDGKKRVKVRVAFSEPVEESPENVGEHGVDVEGGAVTSVSPVGGNAPGGAGTRSVGGRNAGREDREVVWEFEIEPDSDGDVTVSIEAGRPCDEEGAICTADGRSLSEGISTTVEGPDEGPPPLTASFEAMPGEHDGESAFTFRLAFSEPLSWMNGRRLRENVVAVSGGRATAASRVDRRRDLWQVTVEPDSLADVTVTLSSGAACGTPAAVCTKDGRALSETISATVAGPDVAPANTPAEGAPAIAGEARVGGTLTASTSGITDADGLENATFAYQWIRGGTEIPGATGSDYTAVDADEGERLQVRVGFADDAGNAESLTSAATQRVAAPRALPKVLAADARAREGEDATLDFAVTLSAPAPGLVTVDYRTLDASAKAGEDYGARSGTLSFAPGETAKTVSVPVLDDAVDEGTEILVFRLEAVRGAVLADRFAVGRIENSDPLQKMWLSRFGRTVAGQVVDAVAGRLSGPTGGSQVTLGGQSIDLSSLSADSAEARRSLAGALGAAEDDDPLAGPGPLEAARAGSWDDPETGGTVRSLTGRELLLGSSFHLAAGGGEAGGPGYAAWGRIAVGGFEARAPAEKGTVRLDGEVTTGILGADAQWERWLAGVALSVSEGEGSFDQPGVDTGTVESSLTSVNPYVRYEASDRLSVWGLLGYGTGDMTLTQAARGERAEMVTRTDISMRLGAAGARGVLLKAGEDGGIDLALRGDAFLVQMDWEKVSNETDTGADASRLRLLLEAGRPFVLGEGAVLTPALELGLRHDGGDAETGTGVELGGRIGYTDSASGLTVEANARTLIAHEDSGYEEWGAGGSVRIDPGASGRGLSLSLAPVWGTPSSGVERLWSARDAAGLVRDDDFEATRRLEGEIGYGFGAFGERGVVTPYAGFGLAEAGDRTWRAGARWSFAPHLAMSLDGARREPANDDAPEHTAQFRLTLRW